MKLISHLFTYFCCLLAMVSCHPPVPPEPIEMVVEEELPVDTMTVIDRLEEEGTLVAVTNLGPVNYRILYGHPAGFHFDLLDDFSEIMGLNLQLSINDSLEDCFQRLRNGDIDLYAGTFDTLIYDSLFHYFPLELPAETGKTFAWVILDRDNDTSFSSAIQLWLDDFQKKQLRKTFYSYFNGGKLKRDSAFKVTNRISQYDAMIRAEAKKTGWDWRLLASIIYQESHFKPDLESDKGAFGLMQLMPVTMERYGIDYDSPVEDQLEAGVKLLSYLNRELPESITDSLERINFILASYNAGMGNVLEARRRAEKHGKNPDIWIDNVEFYTPKQTYFFVKEVTKRYSHYKNLIE